MTFLKSPDFFKIFDEQMTDDLCCLAAHPVFRGVDVALLAPLLANGVSRRLAAGETLCRERDDPCFWWLLAEGRLESLKHGADGEERIFCQFSAPELVAEVLMFLPAQTAQMPIGLRAQSDCRLLQMRRQDLSHLCLQAPEISLRLLERASQRISRRVNEVEWLARTCAAERLADYFLRLQGQTGDAIELPLQQRQLAATLGIRAETLSRLLADWLRAGVIKGKRRHWEIIEPETLKTLAYGSGAGARRI
jgi:CRP-like cAMP-binding protein